MARLTQIEAVTVVPAEGSAVWHALLNHTSWSGWEDTRGTLRLEDIQPLVDPERIIAPDALDAGSPDANALGGAEGPAGPLAGAPASPVIRVGDRRRCTAVVLGAPLLRRRRVTWDEHVSDVDEQRTIELEALDRGGAIRRWRLRFWLIAQADGQTRLRCRLTYRPATLGGRLFDRLVLRPRLTRAADEWLTSIASSLGAVAPGVSLTPVAEHPAEARQPEPIRIDSGAARAAA